MAHPDVRDPRKPNPLAVRGRGGVPRVSIAQMGTGGPVHGRGGPSDDEVPARLSNGEYVLPADTVAAIGKKTLDQLKAATHKPTGRVPRIGQLADGGAVDPLQQKPATSAAIAAPNPNAMGAASSNPNAMGAAPNAAPSSAPGFVSAFARRDAQLGDAIAKAVQVAPGANAGSPSIAQPAPAAANPNAMGMSGGFSDFYKPKPTPAIGAAPAFADGGMVTDLRDEDPVKQAQKMRAVQDAVFGPRTPQDSYDQRTANYRPGQNAQSAISAPVTQPRPVAPTPQPVTDAAAKAVPAIAGFNAGQAPIFRKDNSFSDQAGNDGGTQVTAPGRDTVTPVSGDNLFRSLPGSSSAPAIARPASYVGFDGKEHADTRTPDDIARARSAPPLVVGTPGESFGDTVIARGRAQGDQANLVRKIGDLASGGFGRTAAELAGAAAAPVHAQADLLRANADADPNLRRASIGKLDAESQNFLAQADPRLRAASIGKLTAETQKAGADTREAGARTSLYGTQAQGEQQKLDAFNDVLKKPDDQKAKDRYLTLLGKDKPDDYTMHVVGGGVDPDTGMARPQSVMIMNHKSGQYELVSGQQSSKPSQQQAMADAKAAVGKGANKDAVNARLKQWRYPTL